MMAAAARAVVVREQRLRAPHAAVDADGGHARERFFGDLLDRFVAQQHGVVDHRVDAAGAAGEVGGGSEKVGAPGDIHCVVI